MVVRMNNALAILLMENLEPVLHRMSEPLSDIGKEMAHAHGRRAVQSPPFSQQCPTRPTHEGCKYDAHLQFRIDVGRGIDGIVSPRMRVMAESRAMMLTKASVNMAPQP